MLNLLLTEDTNLPPLAGMISCFLNFPTHLGGLELLFGRKERKHVNEKRWTQVQETHCVPSLLVYQSTSNFNEMSLLKESLLDLVSLDVLEEGLYLASLCLLLLTHLF